MTFLTRKHLPRRTVLRGLGAAVALPVLDAMIDIVSGVVRKLVEGEDPGLLLLK